MLWKSMATINILQNIVFCVQQNKDTPKGLEQPRVRWWQGCNFWVNITLKYSDHVKEKKLLHFGAYIFYDL